MHAHEHAGPGTIRNHPADSMDADLRRIGEVLSELEPEDDPKDPLGVFDEAKAEKRAEAVTEWLKDVDDLHASDFQKGYAAGFEGRGYAPTSLNYVEGYESGDLAAKRLGKRPLPMEED